jgi:hypothetical protein
VPVPVPVSEHGNEKSFLTAKRLAVRAFSTAHRLVGRFEAGRCVRDLSLAVICLPSCRRAVPLVSGVLERRVSLKKMTVVGGGGDVKACGMFQIIPRAQPCLRGGTQIPHVGSLGT